ncbi:hypothetical protein DYQ86_08445 [Acidobacteria bacterium AB60]|nr:hypothetical protein DYQ86_08445 [Acidobacteria bacterium AB60]
MKSKLAIKSLLEKSLIPLDQAVLCLDCSCVSDGDLACPACSSQALLNLSSVLNRGGELAESLEAVAA